MFVTLNQIYVFISCIAFGGVVGIFYTPILLLKDKNGSSLIVITLEISYFLIISICFLGYSFVLNFPSLRAYMILGVFVGIFLYVKSFHIMLAKVCKKIYNKYIKFLRKR